MIGIYIYSIISQLSYLAEHYDSVMVALTSDFRTNYNIMIIIFLYAVLLPELVYISIRIGLNS